MRLISNIYKALKMGPQKLFKPQSIPRFQRKRRNILKHLGCVFSLLLCLDVVSQSNSELVNPEGDFYFLGDKLKDKGLAVKGKPAGHTDFDAITIGSGHMSLGFSLPALTGKGISILLIDKGWPSNAHQAFKLENTDGSRVLLPQYTQAKSFTPIADYHATQVSGVLAGYDGANNIFGVAPKADVVFLDWEKPWEELTSYATNGATIACLPFGLMTGWVKKGIDLYWYGFNVEGKYYENYFGYYSAETKLLDRLSYEFPKLLIVNSAGNDHNLGLNMTNEPFFDYKIINDTIIEWFKVNNISNSHRKNGFDIYGNEYGSLNPLAVSKNMLVVGALGDDNKTKLAHSSIGPTDDFRIKPDLMANGQNIKTANIGNKTSVVSGTSFSAAAVTAGIALLQEEWKSKGKGDLLSSTIKALLIHTADYKIDRPTIDYGWGIVNFSKALALLQNQINTENNIFENVLNSSNEQVELHVYKESTASMKVTVCWTDPLVEVLSDADDKTPRVVNDIDLEVISPEGNIYFPWSLEQEFPFKAINTKVNNVDNVEQVDIKTTLTGNFIIKIKAKSGKLISPQAFSLIVSGISNDVAKNPVINKAFINQNKSFIGATIKTSSVITNSNIKYLAVKSISVTKGFKASNDSHVLFKKENKVIQANKSVINDFTSAMSRETFVDNAAKSGNIEEDIVSNELLTPETDLHVYPNPFIDKITLNVRSDNHINAIQVINNQGVMLINRKISLSGEVTIKLQGLPKGLYMLRVITPTKNYCERIIKL